LVQYFWNLICVNPRKVNILITGANGFIGSARCRKLASGNKVIGVDITCPANGELNIAWEQAILTNGDSVTDICEKYTPDEFGDLVQ
jgi:nucleoside-diphosphate-sugar epimerase